MVHARSEPLPAPEPAARRPGLERRVAFEAVRQRLFTRAAQPVTVGRFVVTHRVGEGGMGVVYAAYDPRLERKVALKVVRPLSASPRTRALLEREARAAAGLAHPNVVTVFECGTADDGSFFIAMEFVQGMTLRAWIDAAPRRWPELVELFTAAARGLAAAHAAGIVHRDFKPDNVLVGVDERARVADFGLACAVGDASSDASTSASASDGRTSSTLVQGGGTPDYMAPEQHEGGVVGPAADQFGLCVALYEALFHAHPLTRAQDAAQVPDTLHGTLAQAHRRGGVPRALVRAVLRGLERDPEQRHPSLAALVERLDAVLRGRRRRRWLALGVGAAVVTGTAGYGVASPQPIDPCADADARMKETWSAARRDAIATALAELPPPLPDQALSRIDEYARAWSEMRLDSCEATRVRGEQSDALLDLRVACLDRRVYALEGLLAHVERARGARLERTAALVDDLLPLGICEAESVRERQAGANMTRGRTDRSRDPEAERAWQEIARELDDAHLQARLGDVAPAIERLQQAEAQARAHGLTQLEAEVLLLRVHLRLDLDTKADVRAELERALERAQAAAASDTAVECVAELLRLEREQPRKGSDASLLAAIGRGLAARTHDPPRAHARLAQQEASLLSRRGRHEDAIVRYREALTELVEAGIPDEDALVMGLRIGASAALLESGHYDDAEPVLLALWQTQRAVLPPDALGLAPTALQLGHVTRRAGRLAEALDHYRTAYAIFEARLGAEHGNTHAAALGLAKIHHQRGELDEAARRFREVIEGFERAHGREAIQLISPLEALAELERERGDAARALPLAARATALAEQHLGADNPTTAAVRIVRGKALLAAGQVDEAVTQLEAAHLALQVEGVNPTWHGEASLHLARALHAGSAAPDRVRALIGEARAVLGEVATRDVGAATALEQLHALETEIGVGTP